MEALERMERCISGDDEHLLSAIESLRREFGCESVNYRDILKAVVDEIKDELKERYMELPLDADGAPIHVGDKVVNKYGEETMVIAVSGRAFLTASDQICLRRSSAFHHKRDVSDVLREFAIACEDAGNAGDAVSRPISEYAERLRLKEES